MVNRAAPQHDISDRRRELEQQLECGRFRAQLEQQPHELEQQCGLSLRLFFLTSQRDLRRVEKQGCAVLRYAKSNSRSILVSRAGRRPGAHQ